MKDDFSDYIRNKGAVKDIRYPVPLPRDETRKVPIVTAPVAPNLALYPKKRKRPIR